MKSLSSQRSDCLYVHREDEEEEEGEEEEEEEDIMTAALRQR